jgi:TRAP-type C4-dicarboxylate transport system substrate-binding protein
MRAVRGLALSVCLAIVSAAVSARAAEDRGEDGITLRMAAIAPDGTGWARELRAFARDLETTTHNGVHVKLYLGGIAGDEQASLDRVRRGQLDGLAGALFCGSLSPSMTVTRVVGLVQNRPEALYLLNRLRPRIDEEFKKSGFVSLVIGDFGNDILLLRKKVESFAELQKTKMWIWNADAILRKQMALMGMSMIPAAIEQLSEMYDAGQIDGMFVIPTAALAFQWTTRAKYFMTLRSSALSGCLVLSQRAYDQLTFEQQQLLTAAAAKFAVRFEDLGNREDDLLLNTMFEKQGIKRLHASDSLRAAFLDAANRAREKLDPQLLPPGLLKQVLTVLGDYRAEHKPRR